MVSAHWSGRLQYTKMDEACFSGSYAASPATTMERMRSSRCRLFRIPAYEMSHGKFKARWGEGQDGVRIRTLYSRVPNYVHPISACALLSILQSQEKKSPVPGE